MPENRSRKHHQERLGGALREEIASIIEGELADPRVTPAYVTEVLLAPGGKSAHVLVAVYGDAAAGRQALDGLVAARGYIRHELAERLGLRVAPELIFRLDTSEQAETRIDELLHRIAKRTRRNEAAK
jgi:ribosome-binding factor A